MSMPATADLLGRIDAYWRAANYLAVGQIYLLENPLLREPLRPEHIKPRLLGHWGTTPGQNFIYVHLNRAIVEHGLDMMRADSATEEEAVDSHVRSLMPGHLFDVQSTDQHTVKPWFLGKLDFAPPVVDLEAVGFPLVGGRLDYLGGRPAAALVYQRRQHTINVFISTDGTTSGRPTEDRSVRGFHVRHWTHGDMAFWAVSDVNDAELSEFVRAFQAR